MRNSEKQAFPCPHSPELNSMDGSDGLTKREYFAGLAMQGLLANTSYHNPTDKHKMVTVPDLTKTAVLYADALLAQL